MTDTYDQHIADLNAEKITFLEFIRLVNCEQQFKKWCSDHYLTADEGAAQCFYDHYGFEDSTIVKEFIEPMA